MNGKVSKLTRPIFHYKWPPGSDEKPAHHLSNRNLWAIFTLGFTCSNLSRPWTLQGVDDMSWGKWSLMSFYLTWITVVRESLEFISRGHALCLWTELSKSCRGRTPSPQALPQIAIEYALLISSLHPGEGRIFVFWPLFPFNLNSDYLGQMQLR